VPEDSVPPDLAKLKARVLANQSFDYLQKGHWLTIAKSWTWRLTATYFWFWVVTTLVQSYPSIATRGAWSFVDSLTSSLAVMGVAPTNLADFGIVLGGLWLLAITALRPSRLVVLAAYTAVFPFLVIAALILKVFVEPTPEKKREIRPRGLTHRGRPLPVRAFLFVVFLAWFVLYGNSAVKSMLAFGVLVAGVLFGTQVLRSFIVFQAVFRLKSSVVTWFEALAYALVSLATSDMEKATIAVNKGEPKEHPYRYFHLAHIFFRRVALFARGRRGQILAAALVVVDYIWALSLLCLLAVAFWAVTIQTFSAPKNLPIDQLLSFTLAHFVSGITAPPRPANIPFWIDAGASITSWILFVVYLAAASASISERQKQMAEVVALSYKRLRFCARALGRTDYLLRRRKK
jgi:hypothetical protein